MSGISLKKVTKRFGAITVLRDVSLEIRDQEFFVIVGPSGCGKSTLLRILAGLERVSSGSLHIGGRSVEHLPPGRRDVAMVFQNYALFPHLTVFENIAFGLRIRRVPREEIKRLVGEAAKVLGLEPYLDKRPAELSGGQRQRVALGRALVRKPSVFLFDEPLSNLDARLRGDMRAELLRLHKQFPTTAVYVTHDQVEAMTLGERICVIRDGVIQQIAGAAEIYNRPANLFVATFLGTPPMNIIHGTLYAKGNSLHVRAGDLEFKLPADRVVEGETVVERPVSFGVRAENLRPVSSAGKDFPRLGGTVEVAEMTGGECYVHFRRADSRVVARTAARDKPAPGDAAAFEFDPADVHLFDGDGRSLVDGRRIR